MKKCVFLSYFSILSVLFCYTCYGSATSEAQTQAEAQAKALEILQALKTSENKDTALKIIETIEQDSELAQRVIHYKQLKPATNKEENIIELILFSPLGLKLPANDRFEIAQKLWQKDSEMHALEASLKAPNYQQYVLLLYSLIEGEYLLAHNNMPSFFSFICEEASKDKTQTLWKKILAIRDFMNGSCLHVLCRLGGLCHSNQQSRIEKNLDDLLQAGKEILKDRFDINEKNKSGETPLHLVGLNPSLAEKLLKAGADQSIPYLAQGKPILHYIMCHPLLSSNDPTLTLLNTYILSLLQHDTTNSFGNPTYVQSLTTIKNESILHIFAHHGNKAGLELLASKGINLADPTLNQRDNTGKIPYEYVKDLPDETMRNALTTLLPCQHAPSAPVHNGTTSVYDYTPWVIGAAATAVVLGGALWLIKKLHRNASPHKNNQYQEAHKKP